MLDTCLNACVHIDEHTSKTHTHISACLRTHTCICMHSLFWNANSISKRFIPLVKIVILFNMNDYIIQLCMRNENNNMTNIFTNKNSGAVFGFVSECLMSMTTFYLILFFFFRTEVDDCIY